MDDRPRLTDEHRRTLIDLTWKYFDRHSSQRLLMFQYYLTLSTFISGGILAMAQVNRVSNAWPLGYLLAVVSFLFWKLDDRTRGLIKHSERSMEQLESEFSLGTSSDGGPSQFALFARERHETSEASQYPGRRGWLLGHLSYSACFRTFYVMFGVGGFLLGALLLASEIN